VNAWPADLAVLVQQVRLAAAIHGAGESRDVCGVPRGLLVEVADEMERLWREREYWRHASPAVCAWCDQPYEVPDEPPCSTCLRSLQAEAAEAERRLRASAWGGPLVGSSGLPALDAPCPECGGAGCSECEGSGVLPTPAGAQVLGFLARAGWRRP
jgi:hypothetical protein